MNSVNIDTCRSSARSRSEQRFRIEVPAKLTWINPAGSRSTTDGITRDIGTRTASIQCSASPPKNTLVDVEIILPVEMGTTRQLHVVGQAKVIRVENSLRNKRSVRIALA